MLIENASELTAQDLGCSENEFCDLLIDLWLLKEQTKQSFGTENYSFTIMPKGDVIHVTIINDHFYKK